MKSCIAIWLKNDTILFALKIRAGGPGTLQCLDYCLGGWELIKWADVLKITEGTAKD